jgi:porin
VEHHGLASTPYAAPGARLRVDPIPQLYVQAGVYGGNPDRSHSGTDFNLSEDEGALSYFEVGYRINQTPDASGPPGNIKLGAYYHTDDFVDNYDTILAAFEFPGAGEMSPHEGNYGFYAMVDQMLWRELGKEDPARQGLTGFVVAGYAPADRNLAEWGVNGGLTYRGLIPTRDWDNISIAASYLRMSDDIAQAQRDINAAVTPLLGGPLFKKADYEAVLEISYRAQLTAWWTLQASLQRVWHPGGHLGMLPNPEDAWVFILQTAFRF